MSDSNQTPGGAPPPEMPRDDTGDAAPGPSGALGEHTQPEHHPDGLSSSAEARIDTDADSQQAPPQLTAEEVAEVVRERDELRDQLLRARADYDNLNKRRQREVAEARDRGAAALVEGLLDVIDNFGFALNAAAESEDTQLAKGVQLVHDQLLQTLRQAGLEEIPGVGAPFDPNQHEALQSIEDDTDREHPEVTEVLRTGYRFRNHLLRAASVKVAS